MSDEFWNGLNKIEPTLATETSTQPAPVTSGAGVDEFFSALEKAAPQTQIPLEAKPENAFFSSLGISSDVENPARTAASLPEWASNLGQLASGGVYRNLKQWESIPHSLGAIHSEVQGDLPGAVVQAKQAKAISDQAGESEWSLQKIHDAESFSYWLSEKLGEQGITALATLGTGGIAGLSVNAVSQKLLEKSLITAATARSMTLAGVAIPTYALSTAMETAGTSEEQFGVTGSTQPGISIAAGMSKGLLELWTPLSIGRALLTPGLQLGKTIPGALGKMAAREGATEAAQEAIDIYARKVSDPGYSYFKDGPTLWPSGYGEGMWRLLESGATGAAVGAVYGGPFVGVERAQVRREHLGSEAPGSRTVVQAGTEGRLPLEVIADDKIDIEKVPLGPSGQKVANVGGRAITENWIISSPFGSISANVEPVKKTVTITSSGLEEERSKGQGHGLALYKALADEALKHGYTLQSDTIVSEQAGRMYDALERRGYKVEQQPNTLREDIEGKYYSSKGSQTPVFRINEGPVTAVRNMVMGPLRLHPNANMMQSEIEKLTQGPRVQSPLIGVTSDRANQNFNLGGVEGAFQSPGHPDRRQYEQQLADSQLVENALRQHKADEARANFKVIQGDKLPLEVISHDPRDDVRGIGALTYSSLNRPQQERFLDLLDAHTPRYVAVDATKQSGFANEVHTDTELELEYSINYPQSHRPQLMKINNDSIQAPGMTAKITDLASIESGRVWFTGALPREKKAEILVKYQRLQSAVEGKAIQSIAERNRLEEVARPLYEELLNTGLRVLPSRGAGFYYNGTINGEPVANITSTKRSVQVALYDPVTRQITPFTSDEATFKVNAELQKLTDYGVLVAVDMNRMSEDDIERIGGGFKLKQPLKVEKLTPGIHVLFDTFDEVYGMESGFMPKGEGKFIQKMDIHEAYVKLGEQIQAELTQLYPITDRILKDLGIDEKLGYHITDARPVHGGVRVDSAAWANTNIGVIGISPEILSIDMLHNGTDLKVELLNTVMHELGHLITYYYVRELPTEHQDQLIYAWKKALLKNQLGNGSRLSFPWMADQQFNSQRAYSSSYSEWLAEQFRRWSTSDEQVVGWLDKSYKDGAQKLERFYNRWEKEFGAFSRADISQPDYATSAVYQYLRDFGTEKNIFKQMVLHEAVYELGYNLLNSPAALQTMKQVDMAVRSLEHMRPKDVNLKINASLDESINMSSIGAVGRWDPNLSLIELAVGSLPLDKAFGTTRRWESHEIIHAYEEMGLISPREINLLMEDIRGNEADIFKNNSHGDMTFEKLKQSVAFSVKRDGAALEWSKERIEAEIPKVIDKELRAYYLDNFANTGLAYSRESATILQWIIATIERIGEFIRGALGHSTREDLIRAIFKGEMVARQELKAKNAEVTEWFVEQEAKLPLEVRWGQRVPIIPSQTSGDSGVFNDTRILTMVRNGQKNKEIAAELGLSEQQIKDRLKLLRRREDKATRLPLEVIDTTTVQADKHVEVESGVTMHANYMNGEQRNTQGALYSRGVMYTFTQGDHIIGNAVLRYHNGKGYAIEGIQTQVSAVGRQQFAFKMLGYIANDIGIPLINMEDPGRQLMKPPAQITKGAMPVYKLWGRKYPNTDLLSYYVTLDKEGNYYSPNYIKTMLLWFRREIANIKNGQTSKYTLEEAQKRLSVFRELYKKVPEKAWSDPRLSQMFALDRNYKRDEVQGSLLRAGQRADESRLLESLGHGKASRDVFEATAQVKALFSQAENARVSGLDMNVSAPRTMLTYEVRRAWEQLTGYGESAEERKALANTLHEADRIGLFTKKLLTIDQIIYNNRKAAHNQGLIDLGEHKELMRILEQQWLQRADGTARTWLAVPGPKRKEGITNSLFALSEMEYRSASERAAKVVRLPAFWDQFLRGWSPVPKSELFELLKKQGLDPKDYSIIRQVSKDFLDFLADVEKHSNLVLQRKMANSPIAYALAKAALDKDFAELRAKPYFPMMRFGELMIVVRDPVTKKVIESSAYSSQNQRKAALKGFQARHPLAEITYRKVHPSSVEFMSLPAPLLKMAKEALFDRTGKTAEQNALIDDQIKWIEEFEALNTPDRTFRRSWQPAEGLPGYSMDAFRAYSHYFQYSSRYLARLAYHDQLYSDVAALKSTIQLFGNGAKRAAMVQYVEQWLKYIMEPGRDNGKFRALTTLMFLAYSPAAAFMNGTQTNTVTIPWLGQHFGHGLAYGVVSGTLSALKATNGIATGTKAFNDSRAEMIRQGYIEVGQAPELAAFAEGHNLNKLQAITRGQKFYRALSYYGMKMFGAVEHFNREFALKAGWDLAMKAPNTKILRDLDVWYPLQVADLQTRLGLSHQEALAFLFAKETIQNTQFIYDKTSDAPFMRGKMKDILIFYKYTQNMLFTISHNGNGTMMHMLLIMAFLYGLSGVPGSEDLNEIIRAISNIFFGKDLDLHQEARKLVRDITKGTVFDKTGPDLALHGVSRYGFGLGLLPQGLGAPRFDASSNGSMGRIVPGLAEFAHGKATGKAWPDVFAEAAQKTSGAGYGMIFSLMNFLMEKPSADSHKWEQLMQRELKALAKAYRFAPPELGLPQIGPLKSQGAETTRGGGRVAKFDASDPDDVATVLAQAFGFNPTKVSQTWELMRAAREEEQIWALRKQILFVQYDRAVSDQNKQAQEDVLNAVRKFNDEVRATLPILMIKGEDLRASVKQRMQARQLQEQFLASNKRGILVTRQMQDLYPGVTVEKVK